MADSTCNHAPGSGAICVHGGVGNNFSGNRIAQPAPSGADATADMRDGDSDSGSTAPSQPQTTVPESAAGKAGYGGGTP